MRTTLFSVLLVFGISFSASAQTLQVEVTDGLFRAGMQPVTTPYATGGPWAAIPASAPRSQPDAAPLTDDFRIRTWVEGDGVRVLVFAVMKEDTGILRRFPDREEQIASIALKAGESFEVTATDKYNARRITVNALRP
jgi:hypothetical protein